MAPLKTEQGSAQLPAREEMQQQEGFRGDGKTFTGHKLIPLPPPSFGAVSSAQIRAGTAQLQHEQGRTCWN